MDKFTIASRSEEIKMNGEDGYYYSFVYYITASTADGRQWAHFYTGTKSAIEKLEAKIVLRANRGEWPGPINNPSWVEIPPVYGSKQHELVGDYAMYSDIEPWIDPTLTPEQAERVCREYEGR